MADYSFLNNEENTSSSSAGAPPTSSSTSVGAEPLLADAGLDELIANANKAKEVNRAELWESMKYDDQVDALMALTGGGVPRGQVELGLAVSPYALKNVFVTKNNDFSFRNLAKDAASLPFRGIGAVVDQVIGSSDQSIPTDLAQSMAETSGEGPIAGNDDRHVVGKLAHTILRDPVNAAFPGVIAGAKHLAQTGRGANALLKAKNTNILKNVLGNASKWKRGAAKAAALGGAEELTRETTNAALGDDFDLLNVILGTGTGAVLGAGGGKFSDMARNKFAKYADDGVTPWSKEYPWGQQQPFSRTRTPADATIKKEAPGKVFDYLTGRDGGVIDYNYEGALNKLTGDIKDVTKKGESAAKLMDNISAEIDRTGAAPERLLLDEGYPVKDLEANLIIDDAFKIYEDAVQAISDNAARKLTKEDAIKRVDEIIGKIKGDVAKGRISEEKGNGIRDQIYRKYKEYVLDPNKVVDAQRNVLADPKTGLDLSKWVDDPSSKMEVLFNQRNRLFNDMVTNTNQDASSLEAGNYIGGLLNDVLNNQAKRVDGAAESMVPALALQNLNKLEDERFIKAAQAADKKLGTILGDYEDEVRREALSKEARAAADDILRGQGRKNKFVRKPKEIQDARGDQILIRRLINPFGFDQSPVPDYNALKGPIDLASKRQLRTKLDLLGFPVEHAGPTELEYTEALKKLNKTLAPEEAEGLRMFQDMVNKNLDTKAGAIYAGDVGVLNDLGSKYEQVGILNRILQKPKDKFWDGGISSVVNPSKVRKFALPESGIRYKQAADALNSDLLGTLVKGAAYRYDKGIELNEGEQ